MNMVNGNRPQQGSTFPLGIVYVKPAVLRGSAIEPNPAIAPEGSDLAYADAVRETVTKAPEQAGSEQEVILATRIAALWAADRATGSSLKRDKRELDRLRSELAEHLAAMKEVLKGKGREGLWLPFLRDHRIPKTTAERLVLRHRCTQEQKCTTGTLVPAPEVSVEEIVKSLGKKLSVLTTRALADEFLRRVGAVLQEQIRSQEASAKDVVP